MAAAAEQQESERILILAPTGRDAELASSALRQAGLSTEICASIDELRERAVEGAGAAMITEEALTSAAMQELRSSLERQPAWADLPLLLFTSQPSAELAVRSFEQLGARANVTMIERPIRVKTMISAAQAALRARRRQYEIRDLVGELERRVDERDQFLAMLSHELRNPLAAISLAIDSIDGSSEDSGTSAPAASDDRRVERAVIGRQTRHLTKLVDDLLDIARVTTGKIALHRSAVDLVDILEHCVETVRPRADARQLSLSIHNQVEHAVVKGDPIRLEQIVNNLLSNAVKYTPPGGSVEATLEAGDGDAILRVRDSGKGIAPEMLTRIFDMFTQGDVTLDRSEGGMGIGLTLVRKLVLLHDGSVRAYSRGHGSGSEFVVRLPLTQQQAIPKTTRPASTSAAAVHSIVIVEDNGDIRDLLRLKLRHLGHAVETAEDGARGLEKLREVRPDVALVDIGLPGLDGYEVARRVREELGHTVYLIALTGYGQAEDKRKALEAGFDVHLTKPADFVDLQNVLAQIPVKE